MTGRFPLILTIEAGGRKAHRVWDGKNPLRLAGSLHPWKLESGRGAIRLVSPTQTHTFRVDERIDFEDFSLELKPVHRLAGAHQGDSDDEDGILRVYERIGGWITDSAEVDDEYFARVGDTGAFALMRAGSRYRLVALSTTVLLRERESVRELQAGRDLLLNPRELTNITLHCEGHDWSFNQPEFVNVPANPERPREGAGLFQSSLGASGAVASVFILATLLWPRPEPVLESLPSVTAAITLEHPLQKKVAAMASGGGQTARKQAKVGKGGAPAAAFQGEKLQTAIRGLLRGGMTPLLAKSDISVGSDGVESARKLFNAKSEAVHSHAPITGPATGNGVSISKLGGGDANGGNGKGVGYGQGEHAAVTGQGRSLVAMDTSGSNVEEGLTKEEVGKVIHRHLNEVRYCYESSIIRTPDLEGKLVMGFTINSAGSVKVAEVKNSTLGDPNLDDCIMRRLTAWRFPRTKGGIDVAVTYPFIFKTLGG